MSAKRKHDLTNMKTSTDICDRRQQIKTTKDSVYINSLATAAKNTSEKNRSMKARRKQRSSVAFKRGNKGGRRKGRKVSGTREDWELKKRKNGISSGTSSSQCSVKSCFN